MLRVAAGELPETLRIARPGRPWRSRNVTLWREGYEEAVRAAREHGFDATLRLAGGRAAVFHDGTMEIGHAVPEHEPRAGIHERFERTAGRLGARPRPARRGRAGGGGARRVLPRPLQRERPRRGQARRDRPAGRGRRVAHRRGARGERRGADQRRAAARVRRTRSGLAARGDRVRGGGEHRGRAGTPCARRCSAEYAGDYELVHGELDDATLALARELAPSTAPRRVPPPHAPRSPPARP